MRRLIWGFAGPALLEISCHGLNLLYSFEALDATQSRTFAYMINSWDACLPLIWFGKTSEIFRIQTICKLWKQVVERERETQARAYKSLVISKNIMYRCWKWYGTWRCCSCASAFARQSRIFDSIDALHAFYRMPKCLNWRKILSWIPFGSDLDPNSDNVFYLLF